MASYDRAIPPGGVGKITLQVKTKGYQGRTTKSARVLSNDPSRRNERIYLSINVRPYIVVEPRPRILLGGIVGEEVRRVLQIRAADDQPLEILKVETNLGSAIDYKLKRKEGGHGYELEVKVKATDKQISSGFLRILTNHPVKKELKLPVLVRINSELEVRPARILFIKRSSTEAKGQQQRRVLTIVNNRGKPFRVQGLHYNKEYFEVRPLRPIDQSSRYHQLEVVALMEKLPSSKVDLEETLIIRTDLDQPKELKVSIHIQIVPSKQAGQRQPTPPSAQ